ncbi:Rpn family recombination-promoting nuclease/putative transposase [Arcicella sp. LKC2W]|uniref:Rpn family recombination-promoting nuclease/putative transposase n=1 Tax=Arcicella sp. LKC2W TaxID=2984198 RepID=UPI002B20ABCD|nr:Rpn family recombination-promoting nuclease/putative transposase [Arcicella sp. LKC2W]MEA5461080.1 Rpn family recombination-promoting nuclease/putative transposase [Arcicella sp. LKC2W]
MANITNPHDKFFRTSFSRLDVVRSFIEEVLPKQYRDRINLDSLRLSSSSFIDEELSEHLADLVYHAEYAGEPAKISLLFEHKSYQEDFPELQLLQYMNNAYREERIQKKDKKTKKSTVVIPIVIHHGISAWKKVSMRKQFGNPHEDLLKFLPEFDYLLFSLNDFEDEQIANFKNTFLSTTAMLLKHSRDEKDKLLAIESFLIEKLRLLESYNENDFISAVFYYLHSTSNLTSNEIVIIFTKVSTIVTNIAMTATEQLKEETISNVIRNLIQNGASMELISKSFGLSFQKIEEIIQKMKNSSN